MPPPHLCVHTTPCPSKSPIPFAKTSLEHPRPRVASFLLCIFNRSPTDCCLTPSPALVIFLYLFCVNTAYTYKCAHGQPHSVFIRAGDRGMPAVLSTVNMSLTDVCCTVWVTSFRVLQEPSSTVHTCERRRGSSRTGKHMTKKRQSSSGCCISSLQQTSLS